MGKYKIETPIGAIAFSDKENELFNSLGNIELMEKYFETCNRTGFIDPHIFQVMKDRKLVYPREKRKDVIKRYKKLKKEEMIKNLEEIGLSNKKAIEIIDRELNRKCKICGCTFFSSCENGCYWVEDNLCSSCADI